MFWRRKGDEEDPFAALREQSPGATTRVGTARPSADAVGGERSEASAAFGAEERSGSAGGREPRASHGSGGNGGAGGSGGSGAHGAAGPRPGRSHRAADWLLVLLAIVLALGGAGALVRASEQDAEERGVGDAYFVKDAQNGAEFERGDDGGEDAAGDPERRNLVRPAGMRQALALLREAARPGETVTSLRVAPERITAIVNGRDERQRLLHVTDDLAVDATDAGSGGPRRGYPFARVDARAPWRAVRGAARTGRFPAGRLDYLVLLAPITPGDQATWSIFFADVADRNRHWIAAHDGAPAWRPGEQPSGGPSRTSTFSTSNSIRITRNGRSIELSGAQAERISRCIQRAGTDGAAIQRCLP